MLEEDSLSSKGSFACGNPAQQSAAPEARKRAPVTDGAARRKPAGNEEPFHTTHAHREIFVIF